MKKVLPRCFRFGFVVFGLVPFLASCGAPRSNPDRLAVPAQDLVSQGQPQNSKTLQDGDSSIGKNPAPQPASLKVKDNETRNAAPPGGGVTGPGPDDTIMQFEGATTPTLEAPPSPTSSAPDSDVTDDERVPDPAEIDN
ncbi:MAG: hypothetical protein O3C21_12760 [Verrucomicrobia bacterium]|nr:hypothetical protein [Verrucomicrobiota bacterium]